MKKGLFYFFVMLPFITEAQIPITISTAIDTALKNNFDIQIAKNNTEINKINNTFGVAGGLPSINATANDNNSFYNMDQKLSSGEEISNSNVSSNSITSGINASMVLFNGFKITATKERLNCLQKQSELQLNQQIQNTMAAVMVTYYDILRQQSYLNIIQRLLDVSTKKSDIVKERHKVGMGNDADLLQADIDLNLAEQNLKSQKLIIEQEKINLLQLMGVKQFFSISIRDTILVDKNIQKDSIINYLEKNPQYLSAEQQIKINEQIVREQKSQRFPSIKINTGYNYTYTSNSTGSYLLNQNYGPSVGATLQIPLFNGTIYKTQQHVAMYNVKNAEIEKESLLTSLKAEATKTFQSYENTLMQLTSQQTNYDNARKLVNIVIQQFQLNQATILEVKAAEASFENAGYLLVNLQYAAKIAEIELKRLTYRLGN
jgi:outer membrane protein